MYVEGWGNGKQGGVGFGEGGAGWLTQEGSVLSELSRLAAPVRHYMWSCFVAMLSCSMWPMAGKYIHVIPCSTV